MSSQAVKNPASETSNDEPNQKKVRISENAPVKQGDPECQIKDSKVKIDTDQNDNIEQNNKHHQAPNKSETNDNSVETDEDSDKFGEIPFDMDPKVAKALDGIESIQNELMKLNEEASEEILKVEQKFNQLRRPLFEKRNESLKDIPNFWVTTLANHHVIAPMLESDQDEGCLHYLTSLDVEEYEDIKSGYKIKFQFAENPYITNEVIIKSFKIITSDDMRSSSTPIEYKNTQEGIDLKQVVAHSAANFREARSQAAGNTQSSFFAWISEQCETGGTDEVAEILKDQIWPNPLEFFFASGEDEYGATDDDSDDDDDDDDIEDDIDDDADDGAFMSEELGEEILSDEEDNSLGDDDEECEDEDGADYPEEE